MTSSALLFSCTERKKRNVSEKQKAHLDRIHAKALECKRKKADERAKGSANREQAAGKQGRSCADS